MRIQKSLIAIALLACGAGLVLAQDSSKILQLTLDEAVVRALKNNIGIRVAEYSPANSELSIQAAKEKYLPTLAFSYSNRHSERVAYSFLDVAGATNITKTGSFQGSVNQTVPLGGSVTVGVLELTVRV